jgi:hypothetical protein
LMRDLAMVVSEVTGGHAAPERHGAAAGAEKRGASGASRAYTFQLSHDLCKIDIIIGREYIRDH